MENLYISLTNTLSKFCRKNLSVVGNLKYNCKHLCCVIQERKEQEQIEEQKKKAYDLEMARLEREAKERERLRKIEEHKEIKKKHAMERIEQLKKTDIGAKVLQNLDEEVQ